MESSAFCWGRGWVTCSLRWLLLLLVLARDTVNSCDEGCLCVSVLCTRCVIWYEAASRTHLAGIFQIWERQKRQKNWKTHLTFHLETRVWFALLGLSVQTLIPASFPMSHSCSSWSKHVNTQSSPWIWEYSEYSSLSFFSKWSPALSRHIFCLSWALSGMAWWSNPVVTHKIR